MNSLIAICYLLQENDEQNRLWLTEEHFYVQVRGKLRRFDIERIQRVAIENRRWWFPVVAGGILAPLSLLAILLNLYNPWWLISLLVGSMLLWYWGATQHQVLAIHQHHHRQDIALTLVSQNLREFIKFTNRFLRQGLPTLYVKEDPKAWQEAQQTGYYAPDILQKQGFIPAYTEEQWKNQPSQGEDWLMVNSLRLTSSVRYEAEGKQLLPRIYGTIPVGAVHR
ncbi:DUF952 domain-containing protein [Tunicatimonas pelagia]|uniref:DUF952 domain-containing protein n=1 Tax=Tunicatimonas pelagia TaxID=931531 RepID=UPI0026655F8F|nr:DUF952 domain-containing protein [Tunicatimonas pelagia]WKN41610.1 DUF952 domain-containing protein [Tunicatimonas pelagia]